MHVIRGRFQLALFTVLAFIGLMVFASSDLLAQSGPSTTNASPAPITEQLPPLIPHGTLGQRLQSFLGLIVISLIAMGIGKVRSRDAKVPMRTILWGFILQFAFGAIVVWNRTFLVIINDTVDALLHCTAEGAKLVFGDLAILPGPTVFNAGNAVVGYAHDVGYFAFFVLPTIIFFSCLTAVLYHSGIMQYVVQGLAWIMSRSM